MSVLRLSYWLFVTFLPKKQHLSPAKTFEGRNTPAQPLDVWSVWRDLVRNKYVRCVQLCWKLGEVLRRCLLQFNMLSLTRLAVGCLESLDSLIGAVLGNQCGVWEGRNTMRTLVFYALSVWITRWFDFTPAVLRSVWMTNVGELTNRCCSANAASLCKRGYSQPPRVLPLPV